MTHVLLGLIGSGLVAGAIAAALDASFAIGKVWASWDWAESVWK